GPMVSLMRIADRRPARSVAAGTPGAERCGSILNAEYAGERRRRWSVAIGETPGPNRIGNGLAPSDAGIDRCRSFVLRESSEGGGTMRGQVCSLRRIEVEQDRISGLDGGGAAKPNEERSASSRGAGQGVRCHCRRRRRRWKRVRQQ